MIDKTGDLDMRVYFILEVFIFALLAGCISAEPVNQIEGTVPQIPVSVPPGNGPIISPTETLTTVTVQPSATIQPSPTIQKQYEKVQPEENFSEAVEVNYREYVDWFMSYNLLIRAYTPDEYVCGQYTVDMINASKKAGFKAYFGAIRFSDDTGHALVAFKATHFSYTSWYFFEPQTNNQMNPQTIKEVLQDKMGKTVADVTVYGYFDDAGDKDPATWQFAYPLYNQKY
ncbi:MAG: hypothetical protein KJ729_04610 [Euryarchaeota archaeon]|nr:hypothetical protein [Euryarchaeota archaeon]